jgi:hypothetical protein
MLFRGVRGYTLVLVNSKMFNDATEMKKNVGNFS